MAWIQNGKLATYKGGILYADQSTLEQCCCACSVQKAIEERQKAYGITAAWSSLDPINTARLIDTTGAYSYSATNLRDYVNAIAPAYINGTYPVAATYLPPMLTSSYCTSATDAAAVKRRVYAMLSTKLTDVTFNTRGVQGYGYAFSTENLTAAQWGAEATYNARSTALVGAQLTAYTRYGYDGFAGGWFAETNSVRARIKVGTVPSFPGAVRLYGKPHDYASPDSYMYRDQGYQAPAMGYYGVLQSQATVTSAASRWFNDCLSNTNPPPMPGDWGYSSATAPNDWQGWEIRQANTFAVANWNFVCFEE